MRTQTIADIISAKGIPADVQETRRGTGIVIGDGNIRPVFYPELAEGTDEEIALEIIEAYNKLPDPEFDAGSIKTAELILAIRKPVEDNYIKEPYLDLELVLKAKVGNGYAAVTKQLLDYMELSEAEAFNIAKAGTLYTYENMNDVVRKAAKELGIPDGAYPLLPGNGPDMYVVSTMDHMFGASALADMATLEEIAIEMDSDLLIIPSSQDELIIGKLSELDMSIDELNKTIIEVNDTQVSEDKRLSDHAYIYKKGSNQVSFAWEMSL